MRLWAWIVGAVVLTAVGVTGILFVGHRMFETEQHLKTVQSDLGRAKDEAAKATVEIGEREKEAAQLKSELDTSKRRRDDDVPCLVDGVQIKQALGYGATGWVTSMARMSEAA